MHDDIRSPRASPPCSACPARASGRYRCEPGALSLAAASLPRWQRPPPPSTDPSQQQRSPQQPFVQPLLAAPRAASLRPKARAPKRYLCAPPAPAPPTCPPLPPASGAAIVPAILDQPGLDHQALYTAAAHQPPVHPQTSPRHQLPLPRVHGPCAHTAAIAPPVPAAAAAADPGFRVIPLRRLLSRPPGQAVAPTARASGPYRTSR